jgi:HD superfamily phosphodiesterase
MTAQINKLETEMENKQKLRNIHPEKLKGIIEDMKTVFESVPYGITHTLKVLENARNIIQNEKTGKQKCETIIELSAVLHDIGAVEAQRKHGSMEGKFQEMESPVIAENILQKYDYDPAIVQRVCYIVGNHHSPEKIDDINFQILWEADLLENMQIMDCIKDTENLKRFVEKNFKTGSGKDMAFRRYSATIP